MLHCDSGSSLKGVSSFNYKESFTAYIYSIAFRAKILLVHNKFKIAFCSTVYPKLLRPLPPLSREKRHNKDYSS